jgi:S-adenosylmethionine-diacylglycerol 3-amino-3-carboxypropyl transferase
MSIRHAPDRGGVLLCITSGGCNAFDECLNRDKVFACDSHNPQNYLLELKVAVIRTLPYETFWMMFGVGMCKHFRRHYHTRLRSLLSIHAALFWDSRQFYFDQESGGFYINASAPIRFSKTLCRSLWPNGYDAFMKEECVNVEKQLGICSDPRLKKIIEKYDWFHRSTRWIPSLAVVDAQWQNNRPGTILYNGIHRRATIPNSFCIDYVTRVYSTGSLSPYCCPPYLRSENYNKLRICVDRINIIEENMTNAMIQLKTEGVTIDHFFPLDHMDYLTESQVYQEAQLMESLTTHLNIGTPIAIIKCVDDMPEYIGILSRFFDIIDISEDLCFDGSDLYMVQSAFCLHRK